MKVGLHDAEFDHMPKKSFPNYALMKISAYHKARGDTVDWWTPIMSGMFDAVYSSKVFDFTEDNPYLPENTIKGGTGYDAAVRLPQEIDDCCPDYSIYPDCDFAIGFITRGCIRNCRWCVVPQKEGKIKPYRTIDQLLRPISQGGDNINKLVLLDNNILAHKHGISQLEEIADVFGTRHGVTSVRLRIDCNQGLDARLVTPSIADTLVRIDWIKYIRFSCDTKEQIPYILNVAEMLISQGVAPSKIFVYLLVTADIEDAVYRVNFLRSIPGITIYAMPEKNPSLGIMPNPVQKEFSHRYIYSGVWRKEDWRDYCKRNNFSFI